MCVCVHVCVICKVDVEYLCMGTVIMKAQKCITLGVIIAQY